MTLNGQWVDALIFSPAINSHVSSDDAEVAVSVLALRVVQASGRPQASSLALAEALSMPRRGALVFVEYVGQ